MGGTTQTRLLVGLLCLPALAGCSGGTEPRLRPCTASGFAVSLAVGQYVSIDPGPDSGCTVFPANGSSAAEYLLVPQLATGQPGVTSSFRVTGDTVHVVTSLSAPVEMAREPSPAERFHAFLREGDARGWGGPSLVPRRAPAAVQVTYGDLDQFRVCSRTDCSQFKTVTARARAVKSKVAIFVDTLAPPGLDSTALDNLATLFDDRLYASDTAAFGHESDIDFNGVVLVLMTGVVNQLVPKTNCATSGFVAGFFYGADLVPGPQYPNSNAAEIFYSFVADPAGTLSCPHPVSEVERFVPVTFVHEFQHMISFNEHVLAGGSSSGEVLWLNEALSHYAEELAGRTYETTPEARLTGCQIGDVVCRFYGGNLLNAYDYLDSTRNHLLLPASGIGTLPERGALWLFLRYLVDQYAAGNTVADWNAFTRQLVQTTNTGAQNVAAVTGESFATSVSGWALANWVSDLPGFTAPPELQYESWSLRQAFDTLNTQRPDIFRKVYPLIPSQSSGRQVSIVATLRAGSGIYHRATQSPNSQSFTILFSTSGGGMLTAAHVPRLNVIRIQ